MSEKETIEMENEETVEEEGTTFTEEIKVAAGDLIGMVKSLVYEANVRRIVIKQGDKVLLDIPMLLGLGGIALLPVYAALAVIAAIATDHSILVERRAPEKTTTA